MFTGCFAAATQGSAEGKLQTSKSSSLGQWCVTMWELFRYMAWKVFKLEGCSQGVHRICFPREGISLALEQHFSFPAGCGNKGHHHDPPCKTRHYGYPQVANMETETKEEEPDSLQSPRELRLSPHTLPDLLSVLHPQGQASRDPACNNSQAGAITQCESQLPQALLHPWDPLWLIFCH